MSWFPCVDQANKSFVTEHDPAFHLSTRFVVGVDLLPIPKYTKFLISTKLCQKKKITAKKSSSWIFPVSFRLWSLSVFFNSVKLFYWIFTKLKKKFRDIPSCIGCDMWRYINYFDLNILWLYEIPKVSLISFFMDVGFTKFSLTPRCISYNWKKSVVTYAPREEYKKFTREIQKINDFIFSICNP